MQNLTIGQALDRARAVHGLKSDYALCKLLNCSTQLVANWRHGRSLPDEIRCQALAELAQIDADVLIASMNAQRAKDAGARAIWERIAERLALAAHGATAAIFAAAIAIGLIAADAGPASAGEAQAFNLTADTSIHRIYQPVAALVLLFLALSRARQRHNAASPLRLALAA